METLAASFKRNSEEKETVLNPLATASHPEKKMAQNLAGRDVKFAQVESTKAPSGRKRIRLSI